MKFVLRYVKIAILFCVLSFSAWLSVSAEPAVDKKYIEEYITEALYLRLESIDILSFSCTESEAFEIIDKIVKTEPELYFVGKSFYYTTSPEGFVEKITPVYIYTRSETKNIKAYCDRELEKVLFSIEEGMTDFQKALVLHEYMCEKFSYDESLKNHTMYELLRDGRGTCQALTLTYMELLERVGIESGYAYSSEIMHIWNVILLDGEWYHVDITWDMAQTGVSHKNFLLTDAEIEANGHFGAITVGGGECRDEKYVGAAFSDVAYKFECFAGGFICVDNTKREVYYDRLDGGGRVTIYRFDELWKKSEGRYYANSFSAPVAAGDKVYFNTKNAIMEIDESLNVTRAAALDFDAYGIFADEGAIVASLEGRGEEVCVLDIEKSMDIDGDGALTVLDVAVLSLHIYDGGAVKYKYNADVNGDRLLDSYDLAVMKSHILRLGD